MVEKTRRPVSDLEDSLAARMHEEGLPDPVRELVFAKARGRRWRFDFAWPDQMVALEVEGIAGRGKSRHLTVKGFSADCEKYDVAAILGWTLIRVTAPMMKSGLALDLIKEALESASGRASS